MNIQLSGKQAVLTVPHHSYSRPPITEAVIEVRFTAELDPQSLKDLSRKFRSEYPGEQVAEAVGVHFDIRPDGKTMTQPLGSRIESVRRASEDETEILVITPTSMIVSQLAPYSGWSHFYNRFRRDWMRWKDIKGYSQIGRLGMRYINRIDVPGSENAMINFAEYLNIWVRFPDMLSPTLAYAAHAAFPRPDIKGTLTLNTGVVLPSPVPEASSFMLDIDLGREIDVPQKNEEIFSLLDQMRIVKNDVFEACITDKTRGLFR